MQAVASPSLSDMSYASLALSSAPACSSHPCSLPHPSEPAPSWPTPLRLCVPTICYLRQVTEHSPPYLHMNTTALFMTCRRSVSHEVPCTCVRQHHCATMLLEHHQHHQVHFQARCSKLWSFIFMLPVPSSHLSFTLIILILSNSLLVTPMCVRMPHLRRGVMSGDCLFFLFFPFLLFPCLFSFSIISYIAAFYIVPSSWPAYVTQ